MVTDPGLTMAGSSGGSMSVADGASAGLECGCSMSTGDGATLVEDRRKSYEVNTCGEEQVGVAEAPEHS